METRTVPWQPMVVAALGTTLVIGSTALWILAIAVLGWADDLGLSIESTALSVLGHLGRPVLAVVLMLLTIRFGHRGMLLPCWVAAASVACLGVLPLV